ncbi:MAG: AAA family ATPase [Fimbriimonadaceae bacterium]|nr:AAA family ATPase [Fimbriimonadaceae bacterium]
MAEPEAPPTARESDEASPLNALTSIAVEGFKSFLAPTEIAVRPLTILAGANSSGKSSIMQPLLLLKQTQEAGVDGGPLLLDGPNCRVGSAMQLPTREGSSRGTGQFAVILRFTSATLQHFYEAGAEGGLVLSSRFTLPTKQSWVLRAGMDPRELSEALQRIRIVDAAGFPEVVRGRFAIRRARALLRIEVEDPEAQGHWVLGSITEDLLTAPMHIPAVRYHDQRTYPLLAIDSGCPGRYDHYAGSVVHSWRDDPERMRLLDENLRSLGLHSGLTVRRREGTSIELRVARTSLHGLDGDDVNIADVGFGVSQVLPVVVALLAAEPGQTVYLEQPELHLHPRAQVALASLLVDAANRGVRVIAETHSDLLLTGLLTAVAAGRLATEDAILHWFQRDPATGLSTVTSREVDDAGSFGDSPEDFGEVSLAAQSAYLDAAQRRRLARLHAD